MSRESLIVISRLIVAAVFITSILAMALADFFITLITVSGGLIVWLLYLLAADLGPSQEASPAETTFGKALSKVVAGLGGILAVSAFITYSVEQTMWGGYAFDLAGLALALAILWVTLMPLVILQLLGKSRMPAAPESQRPAAALPEEPQPPSATAMPEQQLYYDAAYPQESGAYEGDYVEYDEEGEEWEEEEEGDEDYYEDEEGYEDEDEDEYEEDEDENEDVR